MFHFSEGAVAVLDPRYSIGDEVEQDPVENVEELEKTSKSRSRRREKPKEPSEGIYASLIEKFEPFGVSEKAKGKSVGAKATKAPDFVPPAILLFKKVKGNYGKRVVFKRHIPMLFIRGENVVTVSYFGS